MKPLPIALLGPDPEAPFPPAERALREPDGLLAFGGDLSVPRLLNAYRHGIFPWFSEGQPILWWCPEPRAVFASDAVRLSTKFRRQLRKSPWQVRVDSDFAAVIRACAHIRRPGQRDTWITSDMIAAYVDLHRQGHAHSIEVFDGERLVGGLYGVAIGRMFFGESMFSLESGASKVALAALARILRACDWPLIDAQVGNDHTASLGARPMPRVEFLAEVARLCAVSTPAGAWRDRLQAFPAASLGVAESAD